MRERGARDRSLGLRRRAAIAALLLALWLVPSGADPALLVWGVLLAGAAASLDPWKLWPRLHLPNAVAVLVYLPGFAARSFLGGLDVARRVLDPRLPVRPGFYRHPRDGLGAAAHATHLAAISVLPGSLAAGTDGGEAHVHLLTDEAAAKAGVAAEVSRVARLFGERPAS